MCEVGALQCQGQLSRSQGLPVCYRAMLPDKEWGERLRVPSDSGYAPATTLGRKLGVAIGDALTPFGQQ